MGRDTRVVGVTSDMTQANALADGVQNGAGLTAVEGDIFDIARAMNAARTEQGDTRC